MKRRFTPVGEWNGVKVIDDYAHHPVEIMAETWRYNTSVFILPPWKEIHHTDELRKQDWNEVVFTYNKMIQTYRTYQYDLVEVPKVSVKERADFILDHLRNN